MGYIKFDGVKTEKIKMFNFINIEMYIIFHVTN